MPVLLGLFIYYLQMTIFIIIRYTCGAAVLSTSKQTDKPITMPSINALTVFYSMTPDIRILSFNIKETGNLETLCHLSRLCTTG